MMKTKLTHYFIMNKIKKISVFVACLLISIITFNSCSSNEVENTELDNIELNDLDFKLDFNTTTKIKRDGVDINSFLMNIVDELYDVDLNENILMARNSDEALLNFNGVDIFIDDTFITINPISGVEAPVIYGDNEDCGGSAGDGWKVYGTCMSEKCVKEKMEEAAKKLSASLSSGKCMDVRIKRNSLNAKVCGRVVNCN